MSSSSSNLKLSNLAKTRSRMTTAITFSRHNDTGSRESNTQYWENEISYSLSSSS